MDRQMVLLDCMNYPCKDDCCAYGADVWPQERDELLRQNLAQAGDFTGPARDDEGDLLYRTRIGGRGCVFLNPDRGCRLHDTGFKPEVCRVVPRNPAEAEEMHRNGYLPCFHSMVVPKDLEPVAAQGEGAGAE